MHRKKKKSQSKKTTLRIEEYICKLSEQQGINLQNSQAAHADQYQKPNNLDQKMGEDLYRYSSKEDNSSGQMLSRLQLFETP